MQECWKANPTKSWETVEPEVFDEQQLMTPTIFSLIGRVLMTVCFRQRGFENIERASFSSLLTNCKHFGGEKPSPSRGALDSWESTGSRHCYGCCHRWTWHQHWRSNILTGSKHPSHAESTGKSRKRAEHRKRADIPVSLYGNLKPWATKITSTFLRLQLGAMKGLLVLPPSGHRDISICLNANLNKFCPELAADGRVNVKSIFSL